MKDELFSVAGQVVIVSGGSRGIGRAIAEGFSQRGAQVIVTGREAETIERTAREIAPEDNPARAIVCDIAKLDHIESLVEIVVKEYGQIDTLVNVAGVNRRMPAIEYTEEDYDFIMDVNLKGSFFLSQAAGKHMVERGRGSQINVASINTDRPLKYVLPYAATKAGMNNMTRSLAMEWGPRGVRVNAIGPGFTVTALTRKLWEDDELRRWALAQTPQQRLGQPEDMVGAALFLASDASAFMTGQILYVDGGFTAGFSWPIPM
jgi:NAD(P)-dependent dehydrogenase (short-subunit alcohol dehydrogenase family)